MRLVYYYSGGYLYIMMSTFYQKNLRYNDFNLGDTFLIDMFILL